MSGGELFEVYRALNDVEAVTVTALLESAGIQARIRDMTVRPYPVSLGPLAERRIWVPAAQAWWAASVLDAAVSDGVLEDRSRIAFPPETDAAPGV